MHGLGRGAVHLKLMPPSPPALPAALCSTTSLTNPTRPWATQPEVKVSPDSSTELNQSHAEVLPTWFIPWCYLCAHRRLSWGNTMPSYALPIVANHTLLQALTQTLCRQIFFLYLAYPFCWPSWHRSSPELAEDLEEPMHHSWLQPSLPMIYSPICATLTKQTHISHKHFSTIDQAYAKSPGLISWTPVKFARLEPEGIDIETLHTATSRGKAEFWAWELWWLW